MVAGSWVPFEFMWFRLPIRTQRWFDDDCPFDFSTCMIGLSLQIRSRQHRARRASRFDTPHCTLTVPGAAICIMTVRVSWVWRFDYRFGACVCHIRGSQTLAVYMYVHRDLTMGEDTTGRESVDRLRKVQRITTIQSCPACRVFSSVNTS